MSFDSLQVEDTRDFQDFIDRTDEITPDMVADMADYYGDDDEDSFYDEWDDFQENGFFDDEDIDDADYDYGDYGQYDEYPEFDE